MQSKNVNEVGMSPTGLNSEFVLREGAQLLTLHTKFPTEGQKLRSGAYNLLSL